MNIHPTAIIHETANIHPNVHIGAYSIIGENVTIGADTIIHEHVVIRKWTRIGERNRFFQFCSIGEDCQDLKYQGEETWLEIGNDNTFRESCSVHRGTIQDKELTKIGNNNLFMGNTHIAHDCNIGNHNITANNVGIAGHVKIGNHIIIGGNSGIHQFCRIDDYSIVAGASLILKDVTAFSMVGGNPATSHGFNIEGMKRKNWSKETIQNLQKAYKIVFRSGLITADAIEKLTNEILPEEPLVQLLIDSINHSQRGIIR